MSEIAEFPVTASEPLYRGRVISLRRDTLRMRDGSLAVREIIEHPGAVAIAALDDDGCLVFVNQYRHAIRGRLDELPAGLLDVEGESALSGAQRELAEESALIADDWHVLLDLLPSPGMSGEAIRVFLARGLHAVPVADRFVPEQEEVTMTVSRIPLEEAERRALAGELTNAAAVAGVLAVSVGVRTDWVGLRPADAPWPARPGR